MTLHIMNGLFFHFSCGNESFPSRAPPITSNRMHFLLFRINFLNEHLAVPGDREGKDPYSQKAWRSTTPPTSQAASGLSVPLFVHCIGPVNALYPPDIGCVLCAQVCAARGNSYPFCGDLFEIGKLGARKIPGESSEIVRW